MEDKIYFRPDGGMVLRTHNAGKYSYALVSPDLKVTAMVDQPASVGQADLVAYRP